MSTTAGAEGRASRLRLMVFDVDGVFTDGRLYLSGAGEEMKSFHTLDGLGVKLLRDSGVEVALLTARVSAVVSRRAAERGIQQVRQGVEDKLAGFEDLLANCQVEAAAAGYMGDDLPDLPVLARCGFAASVPNAAEAVRSRVHYTTERAGGRGAVRELCEFVMRAQGTWEAALAPFLSKAR